MSKSTNGQMDKMYKSTNDGLFMPDRIKPGLIQSGIRMRYSCAHMAIVGVNGLRSAIAEKPRDARPWNYPHVRDNHSLATWKELCRR